MKLVAKSCLEVNTNTKGNSKVLLNTLVPNFEYKNSSGKKISPKGVLY